MKPRALAGIMVILLAIVGVGIGAKLVYDGLRTLKLRGTTDRAKLRGTIRGAVDSWLGYSVLTSRDFTGKMRARGYRVDFVDDGADYAARFKAFSEGRYDMVVATVDSYVLGGAKSHYPGAIVAVLDESQGDAIVAKDSIKDVNALDAPRIRIAVTPSSPSDFLLKSVGSHFGIERLRRKGPWRVETTGSGEAFSKLKKGEADAAVLWEPDVSAAAAMPGFHKLIGTDTMRGLIVDILVVRRDFIAEQPELVRQFLREYFLVLKGYRQDPKRWLSELAKTRKQDQAILETALRGVRFASFTDNCEEWLGVPIEQGGKAGEGLLDTIEATVRVFLDEGDLKEDPLPDGNPYAIVSTKAIESLTRGGLAAFQGKAAKASAAVDVTPLSREGWKRLRKVGALRLRPIVFQSGTSLLTTDGKKAIDETAESLSHYPALRIELRGHTAPGGEEEANRVLSRERAEAVSRYLQIVHGIDPDRVLADGFGSSEPIKRKPGQSSRAWRYSLPRVEFVLLSEPL